MSRYTRAAENHAFKMFIKLYKIEKLYKSCTICGWDDQRVDWCHILPDCEGGDYLINNIVPLCPNHHRVLDHGFLRDYESQAITDFIYRIYDIVEKEMLLFENRTGYAINHNHMSHLRFSPS
jgi:hypothetical protein